MLPRIMVNRCLNESAARGLYGRGYLGPALTGLAIGAAQHRGFNDECLDGSLLGCLCYLGRTVRNCAAGGDAFQAIFDGAALLD